MIPAARKANVWPTTAPNAPYPTSTNIGVNRLFTVAWHTIIKLLNSIFSKPIKLAWEAVSNDPENMVMEAIDIRGVNSGLCKIVDAKKLARNRERNDKVNPVIISNVSPAVITSCM